MTYAIEKGVPLPPARQQPAKYPFASMEVRDSFAVSCEPKDAVATLHRLQTAAGKFAARSPGFKFVTRTAPDRTSVRVWRVAVVSVLAEVSTPSVPLATARVHRLADDDSDTGRRKVKGSRY